MNCLYPLDMALLETISHLEVDRVTSEEHYFLKAQLYWAPLKWKEHDA